MPTLVGRVRATFLGESIPEQVVSASARIGMVLAIKGSRSIVWEPTMPSLIANTAAAALMLGFATAAPAASAREAATGITEMLGLYILSQGDQALIQIREDMRKDLLKQL